MKILVLSSEFPPGPGGIGTHAFELASGLKKQGEQVLVLTLQDYVTEQERLEFNNKSGLAIRTLAHKPVALIEGTARLWELAKSVHDFKPEVMIASGERSVWLMAFGNIFFRKPWMAVGHGTEFSFVNPSQRNLTRWSFQRASQCIAVSNYTRNIMVAYGIPAESINVIPNGANPDEMGDASGAVHQDFREVCGFTKDQKVLLTVGNLSHRKGQDIVIRAMPGIVAAGWDAHYLMVGIPTLAAELMGLAEEYGVHDRVHILGQLERQRVIQAYQACDIFVLTSRKTPDGDFEGYGIVAIEAALAGKPVVVTRSGGLTEAVVDGFTAILVDEEDPKATSQAITILLADQELSIRLGEQARQRALSECLWSHRVTQYHTLLMQMTAL